MLYGKQIWDNSIPASKLIGGFLATLLRSDGSVPMIAPLNMGSQRITNLAPPQLDSDAARLGDIFRIAWKDKVVVATINNITLSGLQVVDGVTLSAGQRVLVRAQNDPSFNGIYIVASGSWARSADADSSSEISGALIPVDRGTVNGDKRYACTSDDPVIGTDPITLVDIGSGTPAAFLTSLNKMMAATATTADFQQMTATPIASTPANDSYVRVHVNLLGVNLGDGVKTADCYFSIDSGATALTIANIVAGAKCYWVQTVAGYPLAATDQVDFDFMV